MRAFRLATARRAGALDGEGNRRHGARWNSPGRGVVYAAESASLAVFELLVHVDVAQAPGNLVLVELAVPDDAEVRELTLADYPTKWRSQPEWFRAQGDRWLAEARALALRAPSVVVPQDANVMLNPAHPRMAGVRIMSSTPFAFDQRLIG